MEAKEIGKFIQQRRETLMLKQEDVAEMGGITPKTIYLIEQGKGNPSLNTLQKISNVLGVELLFRIKRTDL